MIKLKVKKKTRFAAKGTKTNRRLIAAFHNMTDADLNREGYNGFSVGRLVKYSKAPTVLDPARNMMAGEIIAVRAVVPLSLMMKPSTKRRVKGSGLKPDQVFLLVQGRNDLHIGTANDFTLV